MSDNPIGFKRKLITGCGNLHFVAFFDGKNGYLEFTHLNKGSTGGCNNFMIGLSRMMSLAARHGASVEEICDQLQSCGSCPSYAIRRATEGDTSKGACCPTAIGYALIDMHKQALERITGVKRNEVPFEEQSALERLESASEERCPECGGLMQRIGLKQKCESCGFEETF